jgi:phosphopantetheinyl transferase
VTRPAAASIANQRVALRAYFADVRDIGGDDIAALVTDDDRLRLDTRAHARRSAQYLAGRALLRFALECETGEPGRSHRLTTQPGGKLGCAGGPAISLAHSGHWVACVIASDGDVGIDVELADPHRHTAEIASQYFSPAERDWLQTAPSDAFYQLWVLKEAYLKCVGRGLAGGLDLLECRIDSATIEMHAGTPTHLSLYTLGDAFVAFATTSNHAPEIRIERWSPSRLRSRAEPLRFVAATAAP